MTTSSTYDIIKASRAKGSSKIMIDHRKHYILMLDTETANTIQDEKKLDMSNVLMYDCGWAVIDTKGGIYETASFVNSDIFVNEKELMQTAYYAKKIPQYIEELRTGQRTMATTYEIREKMLETLDKWGIKEVAAHNARFDHNTLNIIQRWTTKSKCRYWFPFDSVKIIDTMKMANDVICKMPTYKRFCEENNYFTPTGKLKKTAEILYRFISKDNNFAESHTGLEDVLIEAEILWYCYRQHKSMEKYLFDYSKEYLESTPFQKMIMSSLKNTPVLNWGMV